MRALLRTQLPSGSLGGSRRFFSPGPEGVPLTGHPGQLLLQLLDPRRQRGGLLPSRGCLGLHISTAKAEVLRLYASRRQKLVGIGEQVLLLPELVPDVPLPPEEQRLPEGPGLELLDRQNRRQALREDSRKRRHHTRNEGAYLGNVGQIVGHDRQRCSQRPLR